MRQLSYSPAAAARIRGHRFASASSEHRLRQLRDRHHRVPAAGRRRRLRQRREELGLLGRRTGALAAALGQPTHLAGRYAIGHLLRGQRVLARFARIAPRRQQVRIDRRVDVQRFARRRLEAGLLAGRTAAVGAGLLHNDHRLADIGGRMEVVGERRRCGRRCGAGAGGDGCVGGGGRAETERGCERGTAQPIEVFWFLGCRLIGK